MSKDLVINDPTAMVPVPVSLDELTGDAELGGKLGFKDISIPYLYILQSNSPQCNGDHPKYINNAKAGMIYLTVMEKVFDGRDEGVRIVPCYYERLLTEWVDREQGGGLVGSYDPEDPIAGKAKPDDKGRPRLPNGHMLIETAYHYVLVEDPTTKQWTQAIMPLKSTALKASRKMNSAISTTFIPGTDKRAPRFLYRYSMKTIKEQKDQYVWSSPVFTQLDMVDKPLYESAKAYAKIASTSMLRREKEESDQEGTQVSSTEEVPF